MAHRSLHFQFSDPLCKEAVSRSTRYRHLKRRRTEKEKGTEERLGGLEETEEDREETVEDCGPLEETVEDCGPFEETVEDSGMLEETVLLPSFLEVQSSIRDPEYDEDLTELLPEELPSDSSDNEGYNEANESEFDDDTETPVDEKVFSNCPVTKSVSNLLILQYSRRHDLTQEAVADLLNLLSIHCPSPNAVPPSLHSFQGQFPSLQPNLIIHYFCTSCPGKEVLTCPNTDCGKSLQEFRALSSFFELPIEPQIASLLKRMYGGICIITT